MKLTPSAGQVQAFFKQTMTSTVDLKARVDSPDGQGGQDPTWTTQNTVQANIAALTGVEKLRQGAAGVAVSHRILIAYLAAVKPTWRVYFGARIFDIHTVIDYDEQHVFTELMCEERFPG